VDRPTRAVNVRRAAVVGLDDGGSRPRTSRARCRRDGRRHPGGSRRPFRLVPCSALPGSSRPTRSGLDRGPNRPEGCGARRPRTRRLHSLRRSRTSDRSDACTADARPGRCATRVPPTHRREARRAKPDHVVEALVVCRTAVEEVVRSVGCHLVPRSVRHDASAGRRSVAAAAEVSVPVGPEQCPVLVASPNLHQALLVQVPELAELPALGVRGAAGSKRPSALTLVLLHRAGARERCAADGLLPHHRDDGTSARAEHGVVRSVLSEPGHHAPRRLREPHRVAAPARAQTAGEQRLHRRATRAVRRPVEVPLVGAEKRLPTYRAIGYARGEAPLGFAEPPEETTIEYDEEALRHFEEDV